MTDDRFRRWLEAADEPSQPDAAFAVALFDDLRQELGFAETNTRGRLTELGVRSRTGTRSARRRPVGSLLVAALLIAATGVLIAVAGAIRQHQIPPPAPTVLAEIREAGRIRIAIRPDHPQFTVGGQSAVGFDSDVATDIARRLGVDLDVVIVAESTMMAQAGADTWDIALPSVATWTIDPARFLTSTPYYRWPHLLVVPSGSTAAGLGDLTAGPICAVAGDSGEAWLRGRYPGASSTPIAAAVVTRATDADCVAALSSGAAIAAITAHLSAADLQIRADLRVIGGGPGPEPRAVIIARRPATHADPSDLIGAVDDALAAMRADGTLARLSQRRFGGADLTAP